jgi:GPI ethanolamine phosphate transferase 3 subunit O
MPGHADNISAVQMLGLFFFAKGFLLTRLVLDTTSNCTILPDGTAPTESTGCWHPESFEKAIVIIVDALRYDFTIPSHGAPAGRDPGYYLDNLPFLYDTAVRSPANAFLTPFIADPPTSTLQRLKGLTTGTLPVFIDGGSNFAGTAIEEDNLVAQLRTAGKTIVHLGDDTWHSLFPGHFDSNLTHAYDSFNVWDLHTVDNGVVEHIMPLLGPEKQDSWDVIFGHFLGVDHAGHRYGPDHPAMAEKLQQMNQILTQITESIDEKTLLVVMGDHGMDVKGDHGGESDEEVEAALWMYSRKPHFGRTDKRHAKPPPTAKGRAVGQIDLVSTLSLLLGLPIPYNNLGTPIPEAFIGPENSNWENLAAAELLALRQIQNYQNEYNKVRDIGQNALQETLHAQIRETAQGTSADTWKQLHIHYREWHKETIDMYRRLWVNFNLTDMMCGVFVSGLSLLALAIFARYLTADKANILPSMLRLIALGTAAGALFGPFLGVVLPGHFTAVAGSVFGIAIGGPIACLVALWRHSVDLARRWRPSIWGCMCLFFCVGQAAGFAANSFTIHEDTILLFFLSTFGVVAIVSSLRQSSNADRVLGVYQSVVFVFLTRLASFSRLCREEQMPGCRSTFYASSASSTSAPWQLLIPFLISLLLPEIIKGFYKGTASWTGSSGFWIGLSFRAGLVLVALFWSLDAADNGQWVANALSSDSLKTVSITVARLALAVALPVGIATFIWAKPCIDITVNQGRRIATTKGESKPQIVILGYANVYGSRFFFILPVLVVVVCLLLPPMGQFSTAICAWQILCLLEILDTNGLAVTQLSNSAVGPIMLAVLGSYHFFKTGHQAVLSSIQYNAAFVPLRTIHYPWSPLLIAFNEFGTHIMCAAAVPLVVLWKRPLSRDGLRGIWSDVTNAALSHMLYYATIQLATTMWAGHLRRHLMLYRVFMPRFLFASAMLLIVDIALVFVALSGVRVTGLSVGEVFGY